MPERGAIGERGDRSIRAERGEVTIPAPHGGSILVRVFPEDSQLAEDVVRAAEAALRQGGADLRELLESRLRTWYPRLTIRPRDDLASLSQAEEVWYALRDGRVHKPDARLDRLHHALSAARGVRSDADAALGRARALTAPASARFGRDAAVGREAGAHEDGDDDEA